ncbi:related to integral membrane protein [Fusarium torulosum]|uniref:Related to integral membrane protein n=1 Tax=Fusarium torulosum TaxID=33205 RepID=A0AAE8MD37_9HYPO|nr:related to integral membrane protein [Fusarium torulosum]
MGFPMFNGTEYLMSAPAGYEPDFANPYKDTTTINATYWVFGIGFILSLLFFGQRLYTSSFIRSPWKSDDYFFLVSWIVTTAAKILIIVCLIHGVLGVHVWEIPLDAVIWETKLIHATTLIVIPGTVLAKLSLCIFYDRLVPNRWYRFSLCFTGGLTICAFGVVWFCVFFACRPIEAAWNLRLLDGASCINRPPVYMLQAIMGGVTDLLLVILTVPTILKLQMSWRQKARAVALFSTGFLTLGAAVARLVVLIPSLKNPDTTFVLAQGTLWLIVEVDMITICGSLPTLGVFLNHFAPRVLRESGPPADMRYALATFGGTPNQGKLSHSHDSEENLVV